MGSNCHGKTGADVEVHLPLGSVVTDADSGERVADLVTAGERVLLVKGGNGGWGNQHFATPTRQAPRFAKPGLPGEERRLAIELKLLADVAIIGFPNAGKSTLISAISAAKPKIADYPFTTLVPHLGVVTSHHDRAHARRGRHPGPDRGRAPRAPGSGIRFLKHVERCRLLCHLVDASGGGRRRAGRRDDRGRARAVLPGGRRAPARPRRLQVSTPFRIPSASPRSAGPPSAGGLPFFEISAATDAGLPELVGAPLPRGRAARGAEGRASTGSRGAVDSLRHAHRRLRRHLRPGPQRPRAPGRGRGDEVPAPPRPLRARAPLAAQGRRADRSPATASRCWRWRSQGRPDWSIDLEELDREPPSYTIDTLRRDRRRGTPATSSGS